MVMMVRDTAIRTDFTEQGTEMEKSLTVYTIRSPIRSWGVTPATAKVTQGSFISSQADIWQTICISGSDMTQLRKKERTGHDWGRALSKDNR